MKRSIGLVNMFRHAPIALVVATFCVYAAPAAALPENPFTPRLSELSASTSAAGSHPILSIEMEKFLDGCRVNGSDAVLDPKDPPDAGWCDPSFLYMEQDLKKMVVSFPPGLIADANAAPYCDAFRDWIPVSDDSEALVWQCKNPDSMVGSVFIGTTGCVPLLDSPYCVQAGTPPYSPYTFLNTTGVVYNERAGPGEQGHLVILWPGVPEVPEPTGNFVRIDVSIALRDDMSMVATADNIPDYTEVISRWRGGEPTVSHTGAQPYDIVMTIDGSKGEDRGHALLTNPTFCDPQSFGVEFQGWLENSVDGLERGDDLHSPSGEGKTVAASAPYQATACDQVPYNPNLAITLDNQGPDQAPAISSTVTQGPGEATTKSAKVVIPKAFKINVANTATHCPEADLAAKSCPESSRIGTVTAESPLLPIGQKLEGGIYLAGLTSDSVKVAAFLSGFVDLRIDASAALEADGSSVLTFDNLPAVPISKFDLNLEGGDKGLLKTPKICGPQTVDADFTSHSGKVKHATQALEVAGCNAPTLDAALSNRRADHLTDLDLTLASPGKPISSVDLHLARQLHWGARKHVKAKGKDRLSSAGAATFQTASGERKVTLKAKTTKRGNLSFGGLVRKSKSGKRIAAAVPNFSASLFRTSGVGAKAKKKKRGRRSAGRRSSLTFAGLPEDDLTKVELALRGKSKRRSLYIKNPTGCKRALKFTAIVTTTDGTTYAAKDKVRLKVRGCKRKRRG